MCDYVKRLFNKEWSLDDKILCVMLAAVVGVLVGFILSPVKKGICVASKNGCNNGSNNQGNDVQAPGAKEKKDKKDVKEKK